MNHSSTQFKSIIDDLKNKIPRSDNIIYLIIIAAMCLSVISSVIGLFHCGPIRDNLVLNDFLACIIGMIFCLILYVCFYIGIKDIKRQDKLFSTLIALMFLQFWFAIFVVVFQGDPAIGIIPKIFETLSGFAFAVQMMLFWLYGKGIFPRTQKADRFTLYVLILAVGYAIMLIINFFTGFLYYIDVSGKIVYSAMIILAFYDIAFLVVFLFFIFSENTDLITKLTLSSTAVFPVLYIFLTMFWSYFIQTPTVVLYSTSLFFMLFSIYLIFFNIVSGQRRKMLLQEKILLEKEKEQKELRDAIMMSQIKPHFIYNSLATISHLCRKDGALAKTATDKFSDYLRMNLNISETQQLISFEKEFEHIQTYLWLEQLRFGDDLNVEYDIEFSDFVLPPLLLQPIVENAVKHGIRGGKGHGTVRISTVWDGPDIRITISDDGIGFDPEKSFTDNQIHIGLKNVRDRLTTIMNGKMIINSEIGKGTQIQIIFPKTRGG